MKKNERSEWLYLGLMPPPTRDSCGLRTWGLRTAAIPRSPQTKPNGATFIWIALILFRFWKKQRIILAPVKRLAQGKEKVLTILKNEATMFLDGSGIEGIARKMFDFENAKDSLPKYDHFLLAFEKYSKLEKGAYKAETVGD